MLSNLQCNLIVRIEEAQSRVHHYHRTPPGAGPGPVDEHHADHQRAPAQVYCGGWWVVWADWPWVWGRNFKSLLFFCFLSPQKCKYHFFHRLGTPDPMVVVPGRFGPSRVLNKIFR